MKKIYFVILLLVGMATTATMTSCSSDDDPISTAQATDDPRILDPIFPDRVNGELPVVATVNRDQNFSMKLTVTPPTTPRALGTSKTATELDATIGYDGEDCLEYLVPEGLSA